MYSTLGDLYSKEPKASEVINNYEAALAIVQYLVALDSANVQWQAGLIEVNYDLGMIGDDPRATICLGAEQLTHLQVKHDLSSEQQGLMYDPEAALVKLPRL